MDSSDKLQFKELMDGLSEYYQRDVLTRGALSLYFAALSDYPIEQISWAASKHIQSPKGGQFYPKASDIIGLIEGGGITTDQIIAEARLAKTPLGILCRIHIGTWDLKNQSDMFYLRQRAEECRQLLPEWKDRAKSGAYTDHEVSIMLKHKVDPTQSFYQGLPEPADQTALADRVARIERSDRHIYLLEQLEREDPDERIEASEDVRKFISEMIQ